MTNVVLDDRFWQRKLDAYLHDPPEKALDLEWHKQRAEAHAAGQVPEDTEFYRPCDHTAAAADRLPWPRPDYLRSDFDGERNFFKHPLGKACFKIPPFSHADIAHEQAWRTRPNLAHGDARAQFFAFWRLWRWWSADSQASRLAFLPADTRLPDHTIWVHNSIVSAFQACVRNGQFRPAFLLMQIGPVQDYIAQARRTLDLWSGSYLLSYLVGTGLTYIALHYGPDNVIFPNLCGQPIFDLLLKDEIWTQAKVQPPESGSDKTLWDQFDYDTPYGRQRLLIPSLPNRFLAILPAEDCENVAKKVEKTIRSTYQAIANKTWEWATQNLASAKCWSDTRKARFDHQVAQFLQIAWKVLPWPSKPDEARALAKVLPKSGEFDQTEHLDTILEFARRQPRDHRDFRNFECERYPEGTRDARGHDISGWKDPSKLRPDAPLDNPGVAWSVLHALTNWQLDAVRQTRVWQAWSDGGWSVGRECNKDSLNGKEEAILDLRGPRFSESDVAQLNNGAHIPNLFKHGEILGASTLIKRLWPTAWLQPHHGFKSEDWRMPDTRHIADGQPFARAEDDLEFDADADEPADREANKYFAVIALDGDEMGKWVSGTHPNMPTLADQLSPEALNYFRENKLEDLLSRKRPLNPSFHLQFSEMLANFGNYCARRIVEAFDGRLVYAGGDDVLALLPAHQAIPCAQALRAAFRGFKDKLNQLRGAWRSHNGQWQKESVRLFEVEQDGFVKLHSDAPCAKGEPKEFCVMVPGPATDCSVGIAIAHFKHPLQDVVREAQQAQKRAKKKLNRGAVAVTLLKRSGETIQWGCKWDDGGLDAYTAMVEALRDDVVSAKFPHRIIELVEKYDTREEGHEVAIRSHDKEFLKVVDDILAADISVAADRQRGKNYSASEMERLRIPLEKYLKKTPGDQKVRSLIGLCETVAFIARNVPKKPLTNAERQVQS